MKKGPWEELQLFDLPEEATVVVPYTTMARRLFDVWKDTYHGGNPRVTYSGVRERRLIKGLKEFGYDACYEAILGMQFSDWHMGRNKSGQKYTEIRVALRNEDSILRFGQLYRDSKGEDW